MDIKQCDICKATDNVHRLTLPVLRTHDGCDGKTIYKKPIVTLRKLDICDRCLQKSTNIVDDTVMGYGQIYIGRPKMEKRLFEVTVFVLGTPPEMTSDTRLIEAESEEDAEYEATHGLAGKRWGVLSTKEVEK